MRKTKAMLEATNLNLRRSIKRIERTVKTKEKRIVQLRAEISMIEAGRDADKAKLCKDKLVHPHSLVPDYYKPEEILIKRVNGLPVVTVKLNPVNLRGSYDLNLAENLIIKGFIQDHRGDPFTWEVEETGVWICLQREGAKQPGMDHIYQMGYAAQRKLSEALSEAQQIFSAVRAQTEKI